MAGFEEKQTGVPFDHDLPIGKADCCNFHGSLRRPWQSLLAVSFQAHLAWFDSRATGKSCWIRHHRVKTTAAFYRFHPDILWISVRFSCDCNRTEVPQSLSIDSLLHRLVPTDSLEWFTIDMMRYDKKWQYMTLLSLNSPNLSLPGRDNRGRSSEPMMRAPIRTFPQLVQVELVASGLLPGGSTKF